MGILSQQPLIISLYLQKLQLVPQLSEANTSAAAARSGSLLIAARLFSRCCRCA